jgi:hypothetical protein
MAWNAERTEVTSPGASFNGWTCSQCRQWVPNGCTHSCPTTPQPAARPDHGFALLALGNRIADLLERLVVLLEKPKP